MKDYNIYLQKAYKFMIKEILSDIEKEGLDKDSALFISFQTNREDVIIPDFVRAKYPNEISIILQYQFENLTVEDTFFSVDLAFGGVLSTITVPFNAITQFADQSVQFGFKLNPIPPSKKEKTDTKNKPSNNQVIDLESFRKK